MRFCIILFSTVLVAQNFRPVGYFHEGGSSVTISPILAFDANHNGNSELHFWVYRGFIPPVIHMQEYRDYNHYTIVDSIRNYLFMNIGNFDGDNRTDLFAYSGGHLYIYESSSPDSYPTHQIWQSDTTYASLGGIHVADLDSDGKMDFLFQNTKFSIEIYENTGDNNYTSVWQAYPPPIPVDPINFISGDFDQDGKMEFASGDYSDYSCAAVWECIGDNQYELIFCDSTPPQTSNCPDVFYGNDLDQDGKLEFVIGAHPDNGSGYWEYQFRVYEAVGDNTYEVSYLSDVIYRPASLSAGVGSYCGDIDLDGQDEIIWTVQDNWYIYKAVGNNNFQRIFTAYPAYNGRLSTRVYVYDINGNGYPEIIETGEIDDSGPDAESETVIWEIEAVRLIYPNGGELFHTQDTVEVKWQTFNPPGCDSLSLFFSSDSGYNYNTIVTGIPAAETTYQWIVPDTTSDKCMLMIWAYGPGVGWDFTDSTFTIEDIGVSEGKPKGLKQDLRIYPNPSYGRVNLDLPNDIIEINLFDATGRQIKRLRPSPRVTINLPPGVYFLQTRTQTQTKTKKLIILK